MQDYEGDFLLFNLISQGDSDFLWPVIGCFTETKSCWAVRAPFWSTGGSPQLLEGMGRQWFSLSSSEPKGFMSYLILFACKINVITTPTIYTVLLV